jgi:fibrillarin-like rRNA methylase
MSEIAVTDELLGGLAHKLRGLDLTDDEQALLGTIMATSAAAVSDVEPYGVVFQVETTFKGTDEELQAALERATGGLSVWTDMRPLSFNTAKKLD